MGKFIDLTGTRFGQLVVVSLWPERRKSNNNILWKCQCDCGGITKASSGDLKIGKYKSCGCKGGAYKHGWTGTKEHQAWRDMLGRCYNPNAQKYADYGGRGITVCERWKEFTNFIEDMGRKPEGYSLDRINNEGEYSPENCRWTSKSQQNGNKRCSIRLLVNGEYVTLYDLSVSTGMSIEALRTRVKRGWSVERILTQPIIRKNSVIEEDDD